MRRGWGWGGEVAYILTTSAAFNWLFLARKECFSYCLEPSGWRFFLLLPFIGVGQEGMSSFLVMGQLRTLLPCLPNSKG